MSPRYVLRPKADADLDHQAFYFAQHAAPEVGHRFLIAADQTFTLLAEQPGMGWHPRLKCSSTGHVYATVQGMKMRKRRRAGATETVGVSLDSGTKRTLKKLAAQKHQGNVSALIAEMAEEAVRQAAFEKAWAWYGGPELTGEARDRIDAELEEGWRLTRKYKAKKKRRRKAA